MKPCVKCGGTEFYYRKNGKRACKPCAIARVKKWADENKERNLERISQWGKANKDKLKTYAATYYQKNKAQKKVAIAAWVSLNIDNVKKLSAKWKRENKDKVNASTNNRRARLRGAGGAFTSDDIKRMMTRQKGKCVVCKGDIRGSYHIDHVMPIALGGTNQPSNLQLLCPTCNMRKGAKHPVEFMQENGYFC